MKDVLKDAHNTFLKDSTRRDSDDEETQLDDILCEDKAFNWSDDEDTVMNNRTTSKIQMT